MSNEKFIVPRDLTLQQSLDLLFSISKGKLVNVQESLVKSDKANPDFERLPKIYGILCNILIYVNKGLKNIEKHFNINTGFRTFTQTNKEYKYVIENFQILGHDIRLCRKEVLDNIYKAPESLRKNLLNSALSNNGGSSSSISKSAGFHLSNIWSGSSKKQQKALKEQDAKDERLIKQADMIKKQRKIEADLRFQNNAKHEQELELQKERLLDLKIKNNVELRVNEVIEKERQAKMKRDTEPTKKIKSSKNATPVRERSTSPLPKQKKLSSSTATNNYAYTGRGSLDLSRNRLTYKKDVFHSINRTNLSMRRSLDYGGRTSVSNVDADNARRRSSDQNINSAALAAWATFNNPEAQGSKDITKMRAPKQMRPRIPKVSVNKMADLEKQEHVPKANPNLNKKITKSERTQIQSSLKPLTDAKYESLSDNDKHINFELNKPLNKENESFDGVNQAITDQIKSNILIIDDKVHWDDVAGLSAVKKSLKETVVYPFLRPDLFRGLREPIRGMLLFGPPGTGKTMIARAVATESNSTFFSISASSLLSKYLGESEKLVKTLFQMAKKMAPSIIFIDEIDSILGNRSDNENESSRRIKTEVLIQWSGLSKAAVTNEDECLDQRVLVLAATNLPWIIDDAARRRFSRRLYIPLPGFETRLYHLKRLLTMQRDKLSDEDLISVANLTEGYSGSDLTALAKEAAMEPLRELGDQLIDANYDSIRCITKHDFITAMETIKKSVSPDTLKKFDKWALEYGSMGS